MNRSECRAEGGGQRTLTVHSDWIYGFDYPKTKLIEHISEDSPFPGVLFGKPRR